jgi:hypothetical protein
MEITETKVESKVHKSLAQILGIPTRGQKTEQPKVAVVIDPKIAKVLRPHQIEGVKVVFMCTLTAVSLPSDDWQDISRRVWMYHGRRDGVGKDCTSLGTALMIVTMHHPSLHSPPSIADSPSTDDSEMYYCVSVIFGA